MEEAVRHRRLTRSLSSRHGTRRRMTTAAAGTMEAAVVEEEGQGWG